MGRAFSEKEKIEVKNRLPETGKKLFNFSRYGLKKDQSLIVQNSPGS